MEAGQAWPPCVSTAAPTEWPPLDSLAGMAQQGVRGILALVGLQIAQACRLSRALRLARTTDSEVEGSAAIRISRLSCERVPRLGDELHPRAFGKSVGME